jgi:protoporphyrin/coproporphyrin ferrochelatase
MTHTTGLLLVNLGSPAQPTTKATRKYLFQFLHDKRVIELTRWLWCPILHFIILRTRPKRSAANYAKTWRKLEDGSFAPSSPLVEMTQTQALLLQARLPELIVETAMRYGQPSIKSALESLRAQNCTRVAVLPLYPQFACATTASVADETATVFKTWRNIPQIRSLRDYHEDAGYISAIAQSLKAHVRALKTKPDRVLVSFHGLPKSSSDKGDPYESECRRTFALIEAACTDLGAPLQLTFQSRFGPKEWLSPYTLQTLLGMPGKGEKNVVVIAPGFPADCLETQEEIAMEARDEFLHAGGETFSVVPCLNDSTAHIDALENIVRTQLLAGW